MKLLKTTLLLVLMAPFGVSCDVDKTASGDSGELDVDVQAEAPELPEYDVDWANVTVDTRTKTVTVPKVVIVQEEEQVEVPYVDFSMPDDSMGEKIERTIIVEAEVKDMIHSMNINKIYASDDHLIVLAELTPGDTQLNGETVRVSDQVVINVPEELEVKRYIIGARPTGEFNNQYSYIENEGRLMEMYEDAQVVYQ